MKLKNRDKCRTVLEVIGATILILPNGVPFYWGNVSILTLSFIVFRLGAGSSVNTPWVISLHIVLRAVGLNLYDVGKRFVGRRCVIIIGIVVSDFALLSCYFAVQHSLLVLNIALGAGTGFGSGLLYADALHTVVNRADKHVGLLTTMIQGAFAVGGMIFNEFATLYVNPDNLSPDFNMGMSLYFTQKSIIDKIPIMYLFIGGFSFILHAIAFILLNQKTMDVLDNSSSGNVESSEITIDDSSPEALARDTDENYQRQFSPKQMLKTVAFYTIWVAYFVGDFPMILLANYYKGFGQIWIHDDHLLTEIGLIGLCVNTLMRCAWGVVIDKLKVRKTFVVILSPLILVNIWYYFTPMTGGYIYLVSTVLFGTFVGALYSIFPAVMALVFGKTHFSINFGILMSGAILFNLMGPVAIEEILIHFGWFVTFAISAVLNTVGLLLLLTFIPKEIFN